MNEIEILEYLELSDEDAVTILDVVRALLESYDTIPEILDELAKEYGSQNNKYVYAVYLLGSFIGYQEAEDDIANEIGKLALSLLKGDRI